MRRGAFRPLLLAFGVFLASCALPPPGAAPAPGTNAPPPSSVTLTEARFSDLPGWDEASAVAGLPAFLGACNRLLTVPPDTPLGGAGLAREKGGTAGAWRGPCNAARALPSSPAAARSFFEQNFRIYRVGGASGAISLGGFYEPEVKGARSPEGPYQTPLLSRPPDLVTADLEAFSSDLAGRRIAGRVVNGRLVPYYTRAEIDLGALGRAHLAILWLPSPLDLLILQTEGAGRVALPNGTLARVVYAASNGRPFVPIGQILAKAGALPADGDLTERELRAYFAAHPGDEQRLIEQNPNYVFFREVTGLSPDLGPPGSLGVPMPPLAALAVDTSALPLGAPVFVATTDPLSKQPLARLMVAEDTASSLKGPLHADIFFGWGDEAAERAGRMNASGTAFILLPR
jgi:membrane-bound lytic murein transglycosylase A